MPPDPAHPSSPTAFFGRASAVEDLRHHHMLLVVAAERRHRLFQRVVGVVGVALGMVGLVAVRGCVAGNVPAGWALAPWCAFAVLAAGGEAVWRARRFPAGAGLDEALFLQLKARLQRIAERTRAPVGSGSAEMRAWRALRDRIEGMSDDVRARYYLEIMRVTDLQRVPVDELVRRAEAAADVT